jgi:choline dehydrogenase-like flavoprotein
MVRAHAVFYRNAIVAGNAPMPLFMGKMLGGSTPVNGGTSLRPPPFILDRWCDDFATDDFSQERMRPYFEKVESILQVGIPDRKYIGPIADLVDRGCDAYGWSRAPIPRNAVGCEGGGFCDFGCATGAKRSTEISYLPTALDRGAMAFTGLRAERVIVENGRAAGIEAVDAKGRTLRIRSKAVVLAGGAIPTPLFLLKNGLCNSSGEVGKNLTLHPSGGMACEFDEAVEPHRYIPQGYLVDHFLKQGVLITAAQPDLNIGAILFPFTGRRLMESIALLPHLACFAVLIRDKKPNGRVRLDFGGTPLVTYNLVKEDIENLHFGMIRTAEMCRAAGAKRVIPSILGGDILETEADLARFRRTPLEPGSIALTSYHPLGTCKMGKDPKKSVVGLDHEAHDLRGLYVVDGSTVPTALGVNPQVTIMAMATRAAEKIDSALG